MDGLSVAASCIAMIQAADQTYKIISQFLKDLVLNGCNFVDRDLTNITKRDIHEIVSSCLAVASDIDDVLSGHQGKLVSLSWATRGKRKVATSKVLLETNRRALSLAVDNITLATAQNIKQDTANILGDTTHMRGDIHDLVSRIRNLEVMVADKDPDDPHLYVICRHGLRYPIQTTAVKFSSITIEIQKLTRIKSLLEDIASLDTSRKTSPDANTNKNQPKFSALPKPGSISEAITDQKLPIEPTDSLKKSQRPPKLDYVTAGVSQWLPSKLNPFSKEFHGCALSTDGTKLLWREKRFLVIDVESGEVKDIDPKPHRFSLAGLPSRGNSITKTLEVEILTTDASLLLARIKTTTGEPGRLLLPVYHEQDEIAIAGLVPGSSTRVLAIRFPSNAHPEDVIITGQELSCSGSDAQKLPHRLREKQAYTYRRVCSDGKGIISEDRWLIQTKAIDAYGEFIRQIYSMRAIQLVPEWPQQLNVFLPNFDQWLRMRKGKGEDNRKSRIYFETFELE
ncbi:unnamed protein product [Fusarium fujikuroi]|uniref:Fungal N-terminal domain-containing protein n=1 Tax=Fusarium fujikuroi TaxID=5127 RepID=A0A9Q9UCW3_FUSFU|nr:unnamed protein product [Fusarium fujikuroi]VZH87672.1 unnamed protein product [Fusarium fujikuroi]